MYTRTDGTFSQHPVTRDAAITLRKVRYDNGKPCAACAATSVRYTFNERCVQCARIEALERYNEVVRDLKNPPALTPGEARERGDLFYYSASPCAKAGHVGKRAVAGGCYICNEAPPPLTSRQTAKVRGDKWYMPVRACRYCGEVAAKRVDNGRCSGCLGVRHDGRATAETVLMREYSEMVITLEFAKAQGVGVYRTGDPCRRGHRGFRYVSSGSCISCLRGIN